MVSSAPIAVRRLVGGADFVQKVHQRRHFIGRQVPELAHMALAHLRPHFVQKRQARVRDPHHHHPPVALRPLALDEPALVELVDHPGNVRRPRHQPRRQVQRRHLRGIRRPKQAQGVVLLRRQAIPAEQLVLHRPQPVVRPPQVQKHLLLWRIEVLGGGGWLDQGHAILKIPVRTSIVQTNLSLFSPPILARTQVIVRGTPDSEPPRHRSPSRPAPHTAPPPPPSPPTAGKRPGQTPAPSPPRQNSRRRKGLRTVATPATAPAGPA